ncbi:MAG: hypothetical protein RIR26_604 [Pseudomonadota bacterium]
MLQQNHLPMAIKVMTCLPLLALLSCGDKAGNASGKDPRVPIQLGSKTREPAPPSQNPSEHKTGSETPDTPPANATEPPRNQVDSPSTGDGQSNTPTLPEPPIPSPSQPAGVSLTVEISGLNSDKGNVCLSMFNSPDGYPDSAEKAVLAECFSVIGRAFSVTIDNVTQGRYAIAMWHDENRDGKLNYNFLGIPKEGLAFSENGKPRITPPPPGPPSFNAVSFEVKDTPRKTTAKMSYLMDLL